MASDQALADKDVKDVVKNIGIPPCPTILTKLISQMRSDDPDFRKIGQLIGADVGLAAAMLKTVNSPFYGLRTRATSVTQAIALLGLRNVERLVSGLLLRQAFSGNAGQAMEDFWEASSKMAMITAWLAPKVKIANHEEAYTFALFRDCGIAALLANFKHYKPVIYGGASAHQQDMLATEQQQFGVNHAALGYQMATTWLLAEATCDAVLHHHDYDGLVNGSLDISEPSVGLIAVTLAAEWIYTMHSDGKPCQGWAEAGDFALQKLGITEAELESFQSEAESVLQS